MADDLKQFIKEESEETRRHFDEKATETMRHFDVVAEDLKSEIQTVAEQVAQNSVDITAIKEKLEQHDKQFENININLEFIKRELKRKVDYDEFSALAERVAALESKIR
ncbi:MAG: hypothetical protein HYV77_01420 [Candidatus Wildermuthbacteria bacterium]|nr:hypothetical protein [Candidatus Wildermuthbacteria bacterium]